jgi:hypothetical protein
MVNLNTQIDPAAGWDLRSAHGISDNGQIIAKGFFNGDSHWCILTPVKK